MTKKQLTKSKSEKNTKIKTRVNCVRCTNCGDKIYSRATYDFHYCRCGETFVDGGFDYIRCGGKFEIKEGIASIYRKFINTSRIALYNDWNYREDKYGIIGA